MLTKTDHLLILSILTLIALYAAITSLSAYAPTSSSPSTNLAHTNATSSSPYRTHLLSLSPTPHSPTLGFTKIYVLSLAHRVDRRERMSKIARALEIELEFVDAVDKNVYSGAVGWIGERVEEVRRRKRALMAKARRVSASSIGGTGPDSPWLSRSQDTDGQLPFPSSSDARYPSGSWTSHLLSHISSSTLASLRPDAEEYDVALALFDQREKYKDRQVNEGFISSYLGHVKIWNLIKERGEQSALILEDDVDLEWDLEEMWRRVRMQLREGWEVVYLGTCYGAELTNPMYGHPYLHRSHSPRCLHGYAVSSRGASTLLTYLLDPWTAFQTALDNALAFLISSSLVQSWSLEPSLIIQSKAGSSDITKGAGAAWRGVLMDSTWERIRRDEGIEEVEAEEDGARDPALEFRWRDYCEGVPVRGAQRILDKEKEKEKER